MRAQGIIRMFVIILLLTAFPLFHGCSRQFDDPSGENPVMLRLATHQSHGNIVHRILKEEIENRTGGAVQIHIYHGESLLKRTEILDGVADNIVDIGVINPENYPERLIQHYLMQAFIYEEKTLEECSAVMQELYASFPELLHEIEQYNQLVLLQTCSMPFTIISSEPIGNLRDLNQLKVRTSNRIISDILRDLNAIPVTMPVIDSYIALQAGSIDAVCAPVNIIHSSKLYESASFSFTSPEFTSLNVSSYTMNTDTWNKLSDEIQQQILEASQETIRRVSRLQEGRYEQLTAFQERMGLTVTTASDDDIAHLNSLQTIEKVTHELAQRPVADGNGMELIRMLTDLLQPAQGDL